MQRPFNRLGDYQFNSTTFQSNVKDLDIIEQGTSGGPAAGSSFYTFGSADFQNPTDLQADFLDGLNYSIYFNEEHRYLLPSEYSTTAVSGGGFRILIPLFNAGTGDYHLYVSTIATPGGTAIIGEPISLQQVKDHVRVTFSDDDALLTRLMTECRQTIENFCNISIVQKQITALIDLLSPLRIPLGPVISVTSFIDVNGNTIDPNAYKIVGSKHKAINPGYASWYDATLVYMAGYTTGLESQLQLAILNEIAFRYDNRGEGEQQRNNVNPGICNAAFALAQPYKQMAWR